jgi:hypothetical protein
MTGTAPGLVGKKSMQLLHLMPLRDQDFQGFKVSDKHKEPWNIFACSQAHHPSVEMKSSLHFTALLSFLFLLFVAITLRGHARDLLEIVRTYASFRDIMTRNPDVLFRYSPRNEQQRPSESAYVTIPRLIHQISLAEDHQNGNIARFAPAMQSCRILHPD